MNPVRLFRESLYLFRHQLPRIAWLCLPLILLECVLRLQADTLGNGPQALAYEMLVGMFFYPLYSAPLILFLQARSQHTNPPLWQLMMTGLLLWPSFAVLYALISLLLFGAGSLFMPLALWLMVKFSFAQYFLVLEGQQPLAALRESFALSRKHFLTLLVCVLLMVLPLWLLQQWSLTLALNPVDALFLDLIHHCLQLLATVVLFRAFMLCSQYPQEQQHSTSQ